MHKQFKSSTTQTQCGENLLSLSLSLSLVSQLFICNIFFQYFKSFCSFLWILLRATHSQHIFCYAKNRYACATTKSQATSCNDELAKIHKIHFKIHKFTPFFYKIHKIFSKIHKFYKFFSNFHSTQSIQIDKNSTLKEQK